MSAAPEPEAARPSNLGESAPSCAMRPENRADSSNVRMQGTVCSFEMVRGRGDAEVARLAEVQHGHVHLYQLRAAGIGKNAQAHRVRSGRLHATLPGVFLVGRPQRDLLGQIMAAALYLKGDGLAAGRGAAYVWGMLDTTQVPPSDEPIDVLVVGRSARAERGVRIHRTKTIARQDARRRHGIPLTSPARTILDLAGEMDEWELEALLSAGLRKNLVRVSQLNDVIERNPRAKGIGQLRRLLEQTESLHDTRSKYERKFLKLLKAAELPLPLTNIWIEGKFIDGIWSDLNLVYEFDGFGVHGERPKFESDRVRDQHLLIAQQRVIRITAHQIDHAPHALVARTASIIATLRMRQPASAPVETGVRAHLNCLAKSGSAPSSPPN